MNEDLEVFQAFDSIDTARFVLLDLLEENDIPYAIFKDTYRQDIILGASMDMVNYWVKIKRSDFVRVNQLMLTLAKQRNTEVPTDHYLHEMTAEELLQILKNRDEWSVDDLVVAQRLLEQQGITVTDEQIETWYKQKLEHLEQAKRKELNSSTQRINATTLLDRATHIQEATVLNKLTGERKHVFNDEERKRSRTTYMFGLIILLLFIAFLMLRTGAFQKPIY